MHCKTMDSRRTFTIDALSRHVNSAKIVAFTQLCLCKFYYYRYGDQWTESIGGYYYGRIILTMTFAVTRSNKNDFSIFVIMS